MWGNSKAWYNVGITLLTIIILFFIIFLIIIYQLDRSPDYHFRTYDHKHLIYSLKENTACTDEMIENNNNSDNDNDVNDELYNNMAWKTGDILAIAYKNIHGKLVKVFTGSIWTHIGMIYRPTKYMCEQSDGKLVFGNVYIIEMARYGRNERGLIIKPVKEWISWNQDNMIGYRSYNGEKSFPIEEMEEILLECKDYNEDLLLTSWLKTMVNRRYYKQDKDYYYCSEFIVHMMQQMGVLKKKIMPSSFQPWQLLYSKMDLAKGYSYDYPVLFEGIV
jgi:hypothetical protein